MGYTNNKMMMKSDQMNGKSTNSLRSSRIFGRMIKTFPEGGYTMRMKAVFRNLRQINVMRILRRNLDRRRKWFRLYRSAYHTIDKLPVFIVGCNRSGTNMVCAAIGNSQYGWAYQESEFSFAFNGYYLRGDRIIEWLIRRTPALIISFGSILDSQFTNDLLLQFKGAKAIWVYRRYEDVANSCVRKGWGDHQKALIQWVARGELERLGARGKNISNDTMQLFDRLFYEDLSNADAACLYWYMRNQLYFDLELHINPQVLLVQYEDAVLNKEKAFQRIFDFLGFPYESVIIKDVFESSVGKHPLPDINPAIKEVCDTLKNRLDKNYEQTSGWKQENPHLNIVRSTQNIENKV